MLSELCKSTELGLEIKVTTDHAIKQLAWQQAEMERLRAELQHSEIKRRQAEVHQAQTKRLQVELEMWKSVAVQDKWQSLAIFHANESAELRMQLAQQQP